MKFILTFLLFTFSRFSFASYTPLFEVSVGDNKTIHLIILNDSTLDLKCQYTLAWFTGISYKKRVGEIALKAGDAAELTFNNKPKSHPARIRANAICD